MEVEDIKILRRRTKNVVIGLEKLLEDIREIDTIVSKDEINLDDFIARSDNFVNIFKEFEDDEIDFFLALCILS